MARLATITSALSPVFLLCLFFNLIIFLLFVSFIHLCFTDVMAFNIYLIFTCLIAYHDPSAALGLPSVHSVFVYYNYYYYYYYYYYYCCCCFYYYYYYYYLSIYFFIL